MLDEISRNKKELIAANYQINQRREFTVNIALIENNEPTLGVIYAPALSILYYACKNNGSYLKSQKALISFIYVFSAIFCSPRRIPEAF